MKRTREVAAAPVRSASATWEAIAGIVRETLASADAVSSADVDSALSRAAGVGRALVASGHLDSHPVVLVAPPLHLSVTTLSGTKALGSDDSPGVPGGSTVTDWCLHLPAVEPLEDVVRQVAAGDSHLSSDPPPEDRTAPASTTIDREALARRLSRDAS